MHKACNVDYAVLFVATHLKDAKIVADRLHIPTENLLGLAAHECEHGRNRFAKDGNGFFSMRAPAEFQTGSLTALKDPKVKVATFGSFRMAAESFAKKYGPGVYGIRDAGEFSKKLIQLRFNSGNSRDGGMDGWARKVELAIDMVRVRMQCGS
ncbi:hypothetical protein [Massilia genomosp. 1]|uniref:Mannosyl-glycoprotein endo-beta-N-acetylglucosamidase-like domain-containing protein n=1 Tax=Massilia genomosp. 1 TaxID=2609280 RepID=A0ABX0MXT3_9BURK|nr:hypothetical protein [Massilia genomosp. 1]NHZ64893.1 hypothetical protein [Massilia genomosp. 1]